jgi:hypothetical protein
MKSCLALVSLLILFMDVSPNPIVNGKPAKISESERKKNFLMFCCPFQIVSILQSPSAQKRKIRNHLRFSAVEVSLRRIQDFLGH